MNRHNTDNIKIVESLEMNINPCVTMYKEIFSECTMNLCVFIQIQSSVLSSIEHNYSDCLSSNV